MIYFLLLDFAHAALGWSLEASFQEVVPSEGAMFDKEPSELFHLGQGVHQPYILPKGGMIRSFVLDE